MEIRDNVLANVRNEDIVNGTFIIPDNITKIDFLAFAYNNQLEYIEIPDNVKEIEKSAFFSCTNLKYVKLPNGLIELKESVFDGCFSLEKIIFPESLKKICARAFQYCHSLVELYLSDNITEIGNNAFYHCHNLKMVNMSKNIEIIDKFCFFQCNELEQMNISNKIIVIDRGAFDDCKKLNLNIDTSLFSGNYYSGFSEINSLCINGNNIKIKDTVVYQIFKDLKLVREKELKEKIEFELMKNNLFDNKYLNDKKHNEIITIIINKLEDVSKYNYDYRKDLEKHIEEYVQKYVKNKNTVQLTLINDNPLENVLSYLNNYEVSNTVINSENDIIFYGQELEEISSYITNVRYEITLKYSGEMINDKMKKMLKNLTELSGNTNLFTLFFKKKSDIDITLNEDVIRQLRFYAEYKLEQEDEEVTLLEKLKQIIKLYITKVDEQIKYLNNFSYKENNLETLNNEKNKLELTTLVNNKISDLQKNLVIMVEYYKEINSIIGNNLSYMIKLNDIRTVLLPAVVLEVTKNKGLLKKQDSIEKVNNIILMLEEIIDADKYKANNAIEINDKKVDNINKEIELIINDEKIIIKK